MPTTEVRRGLAVDCYRISAGPGYPPDGLNALDLAVDRKLIDTNPATQARPPRPDRRSTVPAIWDAAQLATFLAHTARKRLYPALHLTAHTGTRRGELAGVQWRDLNTTNATLSIVRTRQVAAGRTVETPVKTRTSRRSIDLDTSTIGVLAAWRQRLTSEGAALAPDSPIFLNTRRLAPSPESFSQLFTRSSNEAGLPRIRFHDLPHTHARIAAGRRRCAHQGCRRTPRPSAT